MGSGSARNRNGCAAPTLETQSMSAARSLSCERARCGHNSQTYRRLWHPQWQPVPRDTTPPPPMAQE